MICFLTVGCLFVVSAEGDGTTSPNIPDWVNSNTVSIRYVFVVLDNTGKRTNIYVPADEPDFYIDRNIEKIESFYYQVLFKRKVDNGYSLKYGFNFESFFTKDGDLISKQLTKFSPSSVSGYTQDSFSGSQKNIDLSKSTFSTAEVVNGLPSYIFTFNEGAFDGSIFGLNIHFLIDDTEGDFSKFNPFCPYVRSNMITIKEDENIDRGIFAGIKNIFNSILELPQKIGNFLLDGIKKLFVPDQKELQTKIDNFKANMSKSLGFLYQSGDYIVSLAQSLISNDVADSLPFPEISIPISGERYTIIPAQDVQIVQGELSIIYDTSKVVTSIIFVIAFIFMAYRFFMVDVLNDGKVGTE